MPDYCMNQNAQPDSGDHEVHEVSPSKCNYLPDYENRVDLGWHVDCHSAVNEAKRRFPEKKLRINGCYWCSRACHTT